MAWSTKHHSGFFEAMFDSDLFINSSEQEIPVEAPFEDLLVLKEFVSSSPVKFSNGTIFQVIELSNKMLLDGLEILAINFIIDNFEQFDAIEVKSHFNDGVLIF